MKEEVKGRESDKNEEAIDDSLRNPRKENMTKPCCRKTLMLRL